jgi:hypothetical protein
MIWLLKIGMLLLMMFITLLLLLLLLLDYSKKPHLHLADDQHWVTAVVGHELVHAQVSLAQPRARAVPANHVLARCRYTHA